MNFAENIILQNDHVLLKPFNEDDLPGLRDIAFDYENWRFNTSRILNEEELRQYIRNAMEEKRRSLRYPFTIIDKKSGRIAGSTSLGNYSEKDKRIEIGWTWLGTEFRGTGLNRECKYLLLQYAFEKLDIIRVEFKTDVINSAARKALKKIGAVEEGILRSHMLMQDGRRRDSIYYSILLDEWPGIKKFIFNIS